MPPWRSASVTTPCGSEIQPRICGSGGPPRDLVRAVEPHQFRRAAADVEQHRAVGLRIDQRRAAGGGEPRLGLAIDHFQLEAHLVARRGRGNPSPFSAARQASVAIRRARVTPLFFILLRQIASAAMRALDRRFAQPAGQRDALAEPDDAGKGVDHAEAVAGRTRHQQAAIVGAEIERGIGRAAAIAAEAASDRPGDRRPHRARAGGARSIAGSRPGMSPASPLILS